MKNKTYPCALSQLEADSGITLPKDPEISRDYDYKGYGDTSIEPPICTSG